MGTKGKQNFGRSPREPIFGVRRQSAAATALFPLSGTYDSFQNRSLASRCITMLIPASRAGSCQIAGCGEGTTHAISRATLSRFRC